MTTTTKTISFPYTADSVAVLRFVDAYQENRTLAEMGRGPSGHRVVTVDRRKYVLVDEIPTFEGRDCPGQSGRFMIDKATGVVFTIAGYGKRNHRIGTVEKLTDQYWAASATYRPGTGGHVETMWSRVASWGRS